MATVAWLLGKRFPLIGGAVFGVLLGMLLQATGRIGARFRPGIRVSAKQILQTSVILLGAGLSLRQIVATGLSSLAVMLSTLAVCLAAAGTAATGAVPPYTAGPPLLCFLRPSAYTYECIPDTSRFTPTRVNRTMTNPRAEIHAAGRPSQPRTMRMCR